MSEGLQIQPLGISFQILHHNYTTLLSFLVVSTRKNLEITFCRQIHEKPQSGRIS